MAWIPAEAATAFFGASKPISDDSDIWTAGTRTWALSGATSGTTTVNGVTFSGANPTAGKANEGTNKSVFWGGASTAADNLVTHDHSRGSLSDAAGLSSGGASGTDYGNLSTAYQSLLAISTVGATDVDITLRGLTSGRAYIMQAWANSSDSTRSDNTRWFTDGVAEATAISNGQHSALAVNRPNTLGGTGEFFIATFTAAGATQAFDAACSNAARLTAIQVRDVTGYWSGQTSGEWSSAAPNFMGGMGFSDSQITSGDFAAFTDLGLMAGQETYSGGGGNSNRTVVLSRDISIQSAGVSIGTVRFENDADTYTFTNTSGTTGITGGSAVVLNGTGRVEFNAANRYSGGTTVNSGTLVVNNTTGSGTGTGTVTIGAAGRLEGVGTLAGATTVSGIHAPGNSPGIQTFTNGVEYTSTSIFEWELTSNTTVDRGTSWDGVDLTTAGSLTVNPAATFKLILGPSVDFSDNFWNTMQTWDVFSATSGATIGSVFQTFEVTGGLNYSPTLGSFSMNSGGTLIWNASSVVPEPTSALAGLLLMAGAFRRRR